LGNKVAYSGLDGLPDFKDIGANPAFANAKVTDFEMIESLSAVTRGV